MEWDHDRQSWPASAAEARSASGCTSGSPTPCTSWESRFVVPVLGTSAGAWAGAALAVGVELEVMGPWARTPARRFGHRSVDTVRPVFGDATAPHVFGVAARLSGRRVFLSAARFGVTDIVAASSSPPPFAVPHVVEGRRYIDAGLISICSVDLAPPADLLVVVAPIAGPHMGTVGRFSERQTLRHMRGWRRKSGGRVLYLRPDRQLASAAGSGVGNLFDPGRAGRRARWRTPWRSSGCSRSPSEIRNLSSPWWNASGHPGPNE